MIQFMLIITLLLELQIKATFDIIQYDSRTMKVWAWPIIKYHPNVFEPPKQYFRQQYFKACDLILGELDDRFDQPSLSLVVAMENTLLNAANGLVYEGPIKILEKSLYNNDVDFRKLRCHLALLPDTSKVADSSIKKVTG